MSVHNGFRQRTSGGTFPVLVRTRFRSVIIEMPHAYRHSGALSPAQARRAARALFDAADAIDHRYEKPAKEADRG